MIPETLIPSADLLCEEYLLVQAWKKTAAYIRSHNWYSDTMALDRVAVNLPEFLNDLAERLRSPEKWMNDPLRIVPAPKSQQWRVNAKSGAWEPLPKERPALKLRPLAHVSIKDQVAATALMLCIGDRVETLQGDPRLPIVAPEQRKTILSYGNRLFCDAANGVLHHRWGSSKLYRGFSQDYRRFLSRPEAVAKEISSEENVVLVHSDLKQFYDRVRPELLTEKLNLLRQENDDPRFYAIARQIFSWQWDKKDKQEVAEYEKLCEVSNFSQIALPQGLVAAGFFANVVLLGFDDSLRRHMFEEIAPGLILHDGCRYVDDIRLVCSVKKTKAIKEIEYDVFSWLQDLIGGHAPGLSVALDKTQAALLRGDEKPLVRQSRKMERIQHAISGGFDAIGGEDILDAVQGLVRTQTRYARSRIEEEGWKLAPIPDVRDETVARFAAARYRSTFRSLRPLLEDQGNSEREADGGDDNQGIIGPSRIARTRADLDEEGKAFALGLIENWVENPANVRLLRIGLDLWPAVDVLRNVLELLKQYTTKGGGRKAPRRVAYYCLAEVFRAGATETGFVDDDESLPEGVDLDGYRALLLEEAERIGSLPAQTIPWYLKQQALLFLAASDPQRGPVFRAGRNPETKHYREMIMYLRGDTQKLTDRDFATLAILARRSFLDADRAAKLANADITPHRVQLIADSDPSFGLEILSGNKLMISAVPPRMRQDLCLDNKPMQDGWTTLAELVLGRSETLRNELSLLRFVIALLAKWPSDRTMEAITPCDVLIHLSGSDSAKKIEVVDILRNKLSSTGSLYRTPQWCPEDERWRLQLGYLMHFVLSARHDFTKSVRLSFRKEGSPIYRVPETHWYQRLYGLYSGYSAFGADWLPITDWTEQFLYALLSWPGCRPSEFQAWIKAGIPEVQSRLKERIAFLENLTGKMSGVSVLPLIAPWLNQAGSTRPLRICVLQTVIPQQDDFNSDLLLSQPAIRRRHRNHLSAALAAVERMLDLRETHKGSDGRLDLLVLPELSVHPRDVDSHLIPFVRAHKAIVLAGLTYEELVSGQPLVNSALWLIPIWSSEKGFEVLRHRQGKYHLAPDERNLNDPDPVVRGFRPCQWLIGYQWERAREDNPLWLTASVCYDATDIRLTADLRERSDVFIIPALNRDVDTFDHMALALHYHMFQMVILANTGEFGGSNAYLPYRLDYKRQVFHVHGQPQASISFLEIDNPQELIDRGNGRRLVPEYYERIWKHPPAGWREK